MPKANHWKNLESDLNLDADQDSFQFSSGPGRGKGKNKYEAPTDPAPVPEPEVTQPEPDPAPAPEIDTGALEATEAQILQLLMDYRTDKLGAGAVLDNDARLNEVAEDWSVQMAQENSVYHNPELKADMSAEGYDVEYAREIAGAGYGGSAQRVVDAWIASSGHEQALVDVNAEDIGIGHHYESGTTYGHYFTVVFGAEADMFV